VAYWEKQCNVVWINFYADDFHLHTGICHSQFSVSHLNFGTEVQSQIQHLEFRSHVLYDHRISTTFEYVLDLLQIKQSTPGGMMLQSLVLWRWTDISCGDTRDDLEEWLETYQNACKQHERLVDRVKDFTLEAKVLGLLPAIADFIKG